MPNTTANGIQIEYEIFGDPSSPPLLLIAGLGVQMIWWPDIFCRQLVRRGVKVIRFDNRDIGLSTHLDKLGVPDIAEAETDWLQGKEVEIPYCLDDMADDAAGLLDALKIERAHICGFSMGGMIAQVVAYRHPDKVLSLISIASSTGEAGLPHGNPEAQAMLTAPAPTEREAHIAHCVNIGKILGSPNFVFNEEWARDFCSREYDRNFHPEGESRQYVAIIAHGSRKEKLGFIKAHTLVIHGSADPLLPAEHGKATAAAIPGSELLIIDGMGHDLPRGTWSQIIDAIVKNTEKAM